MSRTRIRTGRAATLSDWLSIGLAVVVWLPVAGFAWPLDVVHTLR